MRELVAGARRAIAERPRRPLRALIPSSSWTGLAASWCPIHGDCICPRNEEGEAEALDSYGCPLHGPNSRHGDDGELP